MTRPEALAVLDNTGVDVASVMYWLKDNEKQLLADRAARIRQDIRNLLEDIMRTEAA